MVGAENDEPALRPSAPHGDGRPQSDGVPLSTPAGASSRIPGDEALATKQLRFRRALNVGVGMWMAFVGMDWLVVRYLGAPSFAHMFACRAIVLAVVLPILIRLHRRPPPSPFVLALLDVIAHGAAAAGIGVMCAEFRGLASPYVPGICLVLLAHGVTAQEPWRRGALLSLAPIVGCYAGLFGSAFFVGGVGAQLHDSAALTTLALNSSYIAGTYLFQVVGGHVVWTLRRQVFEARELGRYRLKRRLAAGSMGEVWVAHHPVLKRDVAVKILAPRADADAASAVPRFEREARATSELSHPNTIRVFDYGTTEDGLWYYVMELLDGETLAERVARLGPLAPAQALAIAKQAARALGEAHERGIVHRDVTPRNVFLASLGGERDVVKVLDFGIAKIASAGDVAMTRSGVLLGTPEYISPEVAQGMTVDARADVYGLGAVIYFLLTGSAPFAATTAIGALMAHKDLKPVAPSERFGRPFPRDLEAVVMRCLEKERDARYCDGAELASALLACTEAAGWSSPVVSRDSGSRFAAASGEASVSGATTGPVDTARSPVAESVSAIESRRG